MGVFKKCLTILVTVMCFLLGSRIMGKLMLLPGCNQLKPFTSSTLHKPMHQLFPANLTKDKAYLSIGILCQPGDDFISNVKDSLVSITNQIDKQTVDAISYIVVIGIESEILREIEYVQNTFNGFSEFSNVKIKFITVQPGMLEKRLNQPDVEPAYYSHHKTYVRKRTLQNILVSSLIWFCLQQSNNFLFTDSTLRLKDDSLQVLKNRILRFEKNPLIFEVKLAPVDMVGSVYNNKYLTRLAGLIYWMSPYGNLAKILLYFHHTMPIIEGDKSKDSSSIFNTQKHTLSKRSKNPLALISTNMKVYDEVFFPTNPYERGELFWSATNSINSTITMKFLQPIKIKGVAIASGKDIYFTDDITKAVLEEAIKVDQNSECEDFHFISDFREGHINLNFSSNRHDTTCLRIRLIDEEKHWVAIRNIQVYT